MRGAVLVLMLFASLAAPAAAVPPIVFEDRGPLVRSLGALRDAGELEVSVINQRQSGQTVTVSVGDVEPPLRRLFGAVESEEVPPRTARRFSIPVTLPTASQPEPGTYTATIIAQGESGPVARREFRLTVPARSTPQGARLSAANLANLTLPATNFAPSLLSPLGPTATVAGIVLLLVAAIFWRTLRGWPRPAVIGLGALLLAAGWCLRTFGRPTHEVPDALQWALFVAAIACVVAALAMTRRFGWRRIALGVAVALFLAGALLETSGARLEDQPAAHLIATKRIAIVPDQVTGTAGVVTDAEGDLARLVASNDRLEVAGLARAGTYTGDLDLSPDEEGGSATVTVTVRDWWLWALLVIGLGVGLGAWVRRYFEVVRPRQVVLNDLNEVLRRIRAGRSQYRMSGRALARAREVGRLLRAGRTEDASKQVDALRGYEERFRRTIRRFEELDTAADWLEAAWTEHGFGVQHTEVGPLRLAREFLAAAGAFDSIDPDTDEADLKALEDGATKLRDLNREARRVHRLIVEHLGGGKDDTFKQLGRRALRATAVEQIAKVKEEADATGPPPSGAPPPEPEPAPEPIIEVSVTGLKAEIASRRDGTEATAGGQPGDIFELTAKLAADGDVNGLVTVSWEFDDGSDRLMQEVVLRDGKGVAVQWHTFARAGDRLVKLQHGTGEIGRIKMALRQPKLSGPAARFIFRDREMTWAAGLLAVGSGMVTLYFADGDWGAPKDYLQAALWGAVVAEGAKLVSDLVTKTAGR